MNEPSERPLSVNEIADRLAVTPKTVRAWCASGALPALAAGGVWRVWPRDLAAFLEDRTIAGPRRHVEVERAVPFR